MIRDFDDKNIIELCSRVISENNDSAVINKRASNCKSGFMHNF